MEPTYFLARLCNFRPLELVQNRMTAIAETVPLVHVVLGSDNQILSLYTLQHYVQTTHRKGSSQKCLTSSFGLIFYSLY